MIDYIVKNKVVFIIIAVVLLVAAYLFWGRKGTTESDNGSGCPNSFSIATAGGIISNNYFVQDNKYYTQVQGGFAGASGSLPPKEISKEAYLKACEQYKTNSNI